MPWMEEDRNAGQVVPGKSVADLKQVGAHCASLAAKRSELVVILKSELVRLRDDADKFGRLADSIARLLDDTSADLPEVDRVSRFREDVAGALGLPHRSEFDAISAELRTLGDFRGPSPKEAKRETARSAGLAAREAAKAAKHAADARRRFAKEGR